ncbi:MAG: hypothetical protein QME81_18400 [bacterium]|nr:hypothetical protein [bacterium]
MREIIPLWWLSERPLTERSLFPICSIPSCVCMWMRKADTWASVSKTGVTNSPKRSSNAPLPFEKLFGKQYLNREAKPIQYASSAQKEKIRKYIEQFKLAPEQVKKRLAAYDAESLDDLTGEDAKVIISKFESAIAAKGNKNQKKKEAKNA